MFESITLLQVWGQHCMTKAGAVDHSEHAKKPRAWFGRMVDDQDQGSGGSHQFCLACAALGTPGRHPSSLTHMFAIICLVQALLNHNKNSKITFETIFRALKWWLMIASNCEFNLIQDLPTLKPLPAWIIGSQCLTAFNCFGFKRLHSTQPPADLQTMMLQCLAILNTLDTRCYPWNKNQLLQ